MLQEKSSPWRRSSSRASRYTPLRSHRPVARASAAHALRLLVPASVLLAPLSVQLLRRRLRRLQDELRLLGGLCRRRDDYPKSSEPERIYRIPGSTTDASPEINQPTGIIALDRGNESRTSAPRNMPPVISPWPPGVRNPGHEDQIGAHQV